MGSDRHVVVVLVDCDSSEPTPRTIRLDGVQVRNTTAVPWAMAEIDRVHGSSPWGDPSMPTINHQTHATVRPVNIGH